MNGRFPQGSVIFYGFRTIVREFKNRGFQETINMTVSNALTMC